MKTNLDSLYKTDETMESEGIWFQASDTVKFRCRRFGGMNSTRVKAISSKYFKPYTKQIEMNTLPDKIQREIVVKSFVEACMVDWEGVIIDGVSMPFTVENAVLLLTRLPKLCDDLIEYSSKFDHYKEDLGNS